MRNNPLTRILDHPWYVVMALGTVALVYFTIGTRQNEHSVKASFSSAFNLFSGQDVRIEGQDVGKIGQVKYVEGGTAIVDVGIDDEEYWPLTQGTTAETRYGTTIGNGTRYIEVKPGPPNAPKLKQDDVIPMKSTTPVVDVDQIVNVFTEKKRGEVQRLVGRFDKSVKGDDLNDALKATGPGVDSAARFLRELGADNVALRGLILNTRKAMGALQSRSGAVSDLVTAAGATFDEFAQNTEGMEQALVEAPATFREARTTLRRLDTTVDVVDGLVSDLGPGSRELTPLAKAATPALSELRATVPSGVSVVRSVRQASPSLQKLFETGTPLVKTLGEDADRLAPMVSCIRPYAPEGAGAINGLAGWTGGYGLNRSDSAYEKAANLPPRFLPEAFNAEPGTDGKVVRVHGLRALPVFSARSGHIFPPEVTPELFSKLTGTAFAYPRPPGLTTGQPWFQPECGVGPGVLDAKNDPDAQG